MTEGGLLVLQILYFFKISISDVFDPLTDLEFTEKIPTPSFQFGGRSGNRESVLVFTNSSKS